MMTNETAAISARTGSRLTRMAPKGAPTTPPMMSPIAELSSDQPSVTMKVIETVSVTANSVKLVEPITRLRSWPRPTSVLVTTAPHPPPPIASSRPPQKPTGGTAQSRTSRLACGRKFVEDQQADHDQIA